MSQMTHLIINGTRQNSVDHLSILDRGLAYGDGVFETMLVDSGRIPLWDYHYQRLQQGLQRLYIDIDHKLLAASVQDILNSSETPGVIKIMVTRGQGGRGYTPPETEEATIIVAFFGLSAQKTIDNQNKSQAGVCACYCRQTLPQCTTLAGIKTLNQLPYVLAAREVKEAGCDEGLLTNDHGHLIEAVSRNVFLVVDGVLHTPQLDKCGVSGVLRRLLIEQIAPQLALNVCERVIDIDELESADEVFLCNGVTGIWPVIVCGEKNWQPGPITRKIQQAVSQYLVSDESLAFEGK